MEVPKESQGATILVQGVNVRNNPFVLLTLLIMSAFLFIGETKNPTKISKLKLRSLELETLVSSKSFNAHDLDKSARTIVIKSILAKKLECSFSGGKFFTKCKDGEKVSWTTGAYEEDFNFTVKDDLGNKKSFSPKTFNPFLSFHKCDVLFKKGASEKSFRSTIKNIRDLNNDQMKVLCLEEGVEIIVENGPFQITKDMAIIGTHSNTATFIGLSKGEVFNNEQNSLFLYNLKIETDIEDASAITLGVGSYLGADNLKIKTASANSKGINCFGCTIDGEGLEVLTTGLKTTALYSSLGLIELRRSTLQGATSLLSKMGSNINLIDETRLVVNLKLNDLNQN